MAIAPGKGEKMMKKIYVGILLILLLTSVCLGACGKREIPVTETESYPTGPSVPATETEVPQTIPTSVPSTQTPQTLEDLLGQDYVQFLTDTITMQMENRMEKIRKSGIIPLRRMPPSVIMRPSGKPRSLKWTQKEIW